MTRHLLILLALLSPLATAAADDAPATRLVSLQAEARAELPNDLMTATVFVEKTDKDPARLAAAVNNTLNEALRLRGSFSGVTFSSGGQSTWPVYGKDNRQEGWRTRATLRLEGTDFEATSRALARLQQTMQLEQVSFSVSPASVEAAENRLISEAIKAFRQRADLVGRGFGSKGWSLVNVSINSGGFVPVPRPMLHKGMAVMAEAAIAPQDVEAGNSTITVGVHGSIQLQ